MSAIGTYHASVWRGEKYAIEITAMLKRALRTSPAGRPGRRASHTSGPRAAMMGGCSSWKATQAITSTGPQRAVVRGAALQALQAGSRLWVRRQSHSRQVTARADQGSQTIRERALRFRNPEGVGRAAQFGGA
jgi:hypothetical protein